MSSKISNYSIPILQTLTKNLLSETTHTIPRYGKLVPIDFLMCGNNFPSSWKIQIGISIFHTHGSGEMFPVIIGQLRNIWYNMVFLIIIEYYCLEQSCKTFFREIYPFFIKTPHNFQFTLIIFLENLHGAKNLIGHAMSVGCNSEWCYLFQVKCP